MTKARKLTDEEANWMQHALTALMRSENEGDPERQRIIDLTYKTFPKEFADNMLTLARSAAAGEELIEKLQSAVKLPEGKQPWDDYVTGIKFGRQA